MPKGKVDQYLTARQLAAAFTQAWEIGLATGWLQVLEDHMGYLVPALQRLAELDPLYCIDPLEDK